MEVLLAKFSVRLRLRFTNLQEPPRTKLDLRLSARSHQVLPVYSISLERR